MKLYYHPLSTYSQKTIIAFHEKGLTYEPEIVDLTSEEARVAYAAIHPIGKVPLLKLSEDWSVPESTAIIEYLEDKYPDTTRLIPAAGSDAARQVRLVDRMTDLYLNDPAQELLFQKLGFRPANEAAATRARTFIKSSYDHLEGRLAGRDWVCGEFSMADCAAIPPLFYSQFVAPFDDRPNLKHYWERAQTRPSYAKVIAEFMPIWEGMTSRAAQ
jgi:glutathione S-transferase